MTIDDSDIQRALLSIADDAVPPSTDVDLAYREHLARTLREDRRRRTSRLLVATAVAAAVAVGGFVAFRAGGGEGEDRLLPATPTTSAQPTSAQPISTVELQGVWTVDADWLFSGFPWLWTFNADGSASGSSNADTAENTWAYSLAGSQISARDRPGPCQYSWRVSRFDRGAMTFDVLNHCGNTGPGIALTRVSPASPAGVGIPMPAMTEAQPLRDVADIGGVWLMQGSGMLLAIEARDPARVTYRLDDRGTLATDPVDQGTVEVDPDGTITLTSLDPSAPGDCGNPSGREVTFRAVRTTDLAWEAAGAVEVECLEVDLTAQWVRLAAR